MVPFWDRSTTHFRTYFSGDWDVHWGYDLGFDPWPFDTLPYGLKNPGAGRLGGAGRPKLLRALCGPAGWLAGGSAGLSQRAVARGCGSNLDRRGKPQVLVHVSTYLGNPCWYRFFEPHVAAFRGQGPLDVNVL